MKKHPIGWKVEGDKLIPVLWEETLELKDIMREIFYLLMILNIVMEALYLLFGII